MEEWLMAFHEFMQKLILARQIKFEEGKVEILNQPMVISPAWAFAYLLKSATNPEEIGKLIYEGTKLATKDGMANKVKKEKKLEGIELTRWIMQSGSLAGWGKLSLREFDDKTCTAKVISENSAIAKLYGKSNCPVDHAIRGFSAGTACIVFGREDIEAIETKCIATGDKICEFLFMPREKALQNKFAKKQLR
jgi:predicted hydrocarbon binding protein